MRAVRFVDPSGDVKLGRLDGEVIFDAGPAGPRGFVPSEDGWRTIADASGSWRVSRLSKPQIFSSPMCRPALALFSRPISPGPDGSLGGSVRY